MLINLLHFSAWLNKCLGIKDDSRVYIDGKPKLLWKQHLSKLPDLERLYLLNELQILLKLGKLKPKRYGQFLISTPQILAEKISRTEVLFASRYLESQKLADLSADEQLTVLSVVMDYLQDLQKLPSLQAASKLGVRNSWSIFQGGLIYGLMAAIRRPKLSLQILRATAQFWRLYSQYVWHQAPLKLSHRDLDPDNIRVSGHRVLLTDWENTISTDALFDLSQVPRLYGRHVTWERAVEFCLSRLTTQEEQNHWRALALYGILQALSIKPSDSHMFASAEAGLHYFVPAKSAFEYLYFSCLAIISWLLPFLPAGWRRPQGGFILCYHSIGYDNWRFTTRPQQLAEQLHYLDKRFEIKSLTEVLKTGKGAAITFDDGYQNVVEHALPVLKKLDKSATVFVIGDPANVDRQQLDNNLPLLQPSDLKLLQNAGWEVGFHTQSHPYLAKLTETQLDQEIGQAKKSWERKHHQVLNYFAYPRGFFSSKITKVVDQAGFAAAFTITGQPYAQSENNLLLPRIPMEGDLSVSLLKAYLSPIGNSLSRLLFTLLRLKSSLTS